MTKASRTNNRTVSSSSRTKGISPKIKDYPSESRKVRAYDNEN